MDKFRGIYRISSARLLDWNYGWNAPYFITICTANRNCYFGEIVDSEMKLSEIGRMAKQYWFEIPNHFPFVILDEFVVMPNHVHGIILINKQNDRSNDEQNDGRNVETQNFASLPSQPSPPSPSPPLPDMPIQRIMNKFGPQSQNLASIIRGYKTGVKKYATINNIDFAWQPRFYDHIIRNDDSYKSIRNYIINNPKNGIRISKSEFYNLRMIGCME